MANADWPVLLTCIALLCWSAVCVQVAVTALTPEDIRARWRRRQQTTDPGTDTCRRGDTGIWPVVWLTSVGAAVYGMALLLGNQG